MKSFLLLITLAAAQVVSAAVVTPWRTITDKPTSAQGYGILNGAAMDAWAAVTTSAQLRAIIGDETGTGALVFATSPQLVTPNIGAATGTSLALGGNVTLSTLGTGLLRADAPSGTAAGYRLALAGVDVAQFSISGGNTFLDYAGILTLRSGFGGTSRATLDASGNLGVSGNLTLPNLSATVTLGTISGSQQNYHIQTAQAGGAIRLRQDSATTTRGFSLGLVNNGGTYTEKLTYNDGTDTLTAAGNLTVGGSGPHSFAGRVNTTINAGGNGFISTLRNSGGNGILELVGTSAGPAEKAAQLFADGTGNFTLYTNATPGTLGTAAMTVAPAGNISLLGVTAFKGTTANDNAATGYAGEFLNATVGSGGAYSLTSGTVYSVTSIGLTPGDWDLEGSAVFTQAGGTTATDYIVGITNSLSAWDGGETSYARTGFLTSAATTLTGTMPAVKRRVSTSSSITYYLLVRGTFTGGTLTVYGNINARRVR